MIIDTSVEETYVSGSVEAVWTGVETDVTSCD